MTYVKQIIILKYEFLLLNIYGYGVRIHDFLWNECWEYERF